LGISDTVAVALGDVDGDGDLDAFVGNYNQANRVWMNGLRDLVVESLVAEPASLKVNQSFAVTVTIRNQGTGDVLTSFSTAVYSDHVPSPCDGGAGSWASMATISLTAGASAILTFTHPGFASVGQHTIYAQADVQCACDNNPNNNISAPLILWVNPFTVTATGPSGNGLVIARDGVISATFSQVVDSSTVNTRTFAVRGRQTGVYTGSYAFGSVQFDAANDFKPGEEIVVNLSNGIKAIEGSRLTPYAWQFRAAVVSGTGVFEDGGQTLGGSDTSGVALGDVDGDGDLDAFAGNYGQANRVWLNGGDGFTDSGQRLGSFWSAAVALGDVDGDGDLDAFAGNNGQANRVWLNDGGVFTESGQALGVEDTSAVALGDVDGDGDLDTFVGNDGQANTVWLNDGTGVLTDSGQRLGLEDTSAVALGDLDGDGDLDALVGNYLQADQVWLNDGTGVFTDSGQCLEYYFATRAVALEDVDGDGDLDAFVGIVGGADWVWLNDGAGVFSDSGQRLGSSDTNSVALGDVDGDGDLDTFVGNSGQANTVWLNDGAGVFADSGQRLGSSRTYAVALGDVNGDGDLDGFVGNDSQANVVWINDLRDLAVESIVAEPAFPKLDQSFTVTVTIRNQSTGDVLTSFSTAVYSDHVPSPCDGGAGSWASTATISLTAGASAILTFTHPGFVSVGQHAIYAQVDASCACDDKPNNNIAGPLVVWVNTFPVTATSPPGNGLVIARDGVISATFGQVVSSSTVNTRTFAVRGRQTGVYTGSYTFGSVQFDAANDFKPGEEIVVNLSDGIKAMDDSGLLPYAWQFRAAVVDSTGIFSDSGQTVGISKTYAVVLGDVDVDGDLDVFVAGYLTNTVWLNDGGVFTGSGQSLGSGSYAVALGDLDGDADLDAFVGHGDPYGGAPNRVWLNDGTGIFTDSGQALGNSKSLALALGDVDGDGDLDAFVGNDEEAGKVWLNDGAGVFTDSLQTLGTSSVQAVALGDVDGDGDLDAFIGNTFETNQVWLNDGTGVFANSGQDLGSSNTYAVALGDVDGDGDLDVFFGNVGNVEVRLNDGTGVFTDSGQSLSSSNTMAVALGDVDGNGDLDAFVGCGGEVGRPNMVWLNNGGVFADSGQRLGNEGTTAVALGDVDGDGDLDGFVGNERGSGELDTVWLNTRIPPTANDDHFAVPADSSANVLRVLANDSSFLYADVVTVTAVSTPVSGSASTDGSAVIYTPTLGFTGTDVFTYTISDPGALTATATITVDVGGVNNAPVAQDDSATTNEDTPVTINVLDNDSDPDGQTPFVLAVGTPISGSAIVDSSKVVYTPLPDLSGVDIFTYTISDGWMIGTATVTVTVNPIEDPPTLDSLPDMVIDEDAPTQTIPLSNITSGAFDENQVLTVTASATKYDLADLLVVSVTYTSPYTTGILSLTPITDLFGWSEVTVVVSDGLAQTERKFGVTVNSVNDPPTLNPISDLVIGEDAGPQTVGLSGISFGPINEYEQRPDLAVTAFSTNVGLIPHPSVYYDNHPGHYTGGSLVFTPVADQSGLATVVVTVTDGISETVRTFQVIVNAVNDPPTLDAIGDQVIDEDATMQTVNLSGITSGAADESQILAVTATSTDTNLIPHPSVNYVSPNTTGSLQFAPIADQFGLATVVVTASDGLSETSRSFLVTVNPVNDPPTLGAIPDLVTDENAGVQTVPLSGITAGPNESQPLTVTAVSTDTNLIPHPGVTYTSPNPTGSLSFTPVLDQWGVATVDVTVSDGFSQTSRSFQVIVRPTFEVFATSPPGNGLAIARTGAISATLTQTADDSTVDTRTFTVRGRQTGVYGGNYTFGSMQFEGTFTFGSVQFDAANDFKPGEEIVVNLSDGLKAMDGSSLVSYVWQFRAAVGGGTGVFVDSGQALGYYGDLPWLLRGLQPLSVLDTQAVALGDVDGDGDLDAYVVRNGARSTVWLNDGTGTFSDSGQSLGSSYSWAVALGDLDGDGDLDACVGNYGQGNTVWLNDGAGTFSDSGQSLDSSDTYAVALGDVDGDGDLDAVTGNDVGQANRVWLNDGAGTFSYSGRSLGFRDTRGIALGDLDGDGDLDGFAGNSDGQANQVWLNDGAGHFSDSGQRLGSSDTYAVALGDLDSDGDFDVLVGNMNGEADEVWLNDGVGTFGDSGQRLGSSATWAVALGDVDADSDLDAVVGNVRFGDALDQPNWVWLNDGTGTFGGGGQSLGTWDTLAVALGDADGDGDLDALLGNSNGLYQTNRLYLNQPNLPLAMNDSFYVPADSGATDLDVPANDRDPDGDALVVTAVGTPAHGSASTGGSTVTYTPPPGFSGRDVFTYTVSDPGGLTDAATVSVIVFEETLSTVATPTRGGSLFYTDEQGSTIIVDIPAGAVSKPTEFRYTPLVGPTTSAASLAFAGQSFTLEAYRGGEPVPGIVFSTPITITIHYSGADVAGLVEDTLELRYWDGSAWAGDGIALVKRDTAINRLVVRVTHLTEFALFGNGQNRIYLPVVLNRSTPGVPDPSHTAGFGSPDRGWQSGRIRWE